MMPDAESMKPSAPSRSIAAMFRPPEPDEPGDLAIAGLPPTTAPTQRAGRKTPAADLTGLAKVWCLIGPGGAGKTVLARWLGGELAQRGVLDNTMMSALDPTNRSLAHYFDGVQQPPSANADETVAWLRRALEFIRQHRANAVFDFGGGDTSLARLIEQAPGLAGAMEGEGVALIACYVLTPRVDDLASLVTFEAAGFRPRATALVLNLGRAETPAAFDAVRRSAPYKTALARGAVELWLPAMEQAFALKIEQARVQYHQARDGEAPEGRKPAALGMLERLAVRAWLMAVAEEMQAVEGWMPWA